MAQIGSASTYAAQDQSDGCHAPASRPCQPTHARTTMLRFDIPFRRSEEEDSAEQWPGDGSAWRPVSSVLPPGNRESRRSSRASRKVSTARAWIAATSLLTLQVQFLIIVPIRCSEPRVPSECRSVLVVDHVIAALDNFLKAPCALPLSVPRSEQRSGVVSARPDEKRPSRCRSRAP